MADQIIKLRPPSDTALGFRTLDSLKGEASIAPDPLAGRFVKEGSPEALRIMQQQQNQILQARGLVAQQKPLSPVFPSTAKVAVNNNFHRGEKVYHAVRKQKYTVVGSVKGSSTLVEVKASGADKATIVRKDNLVRCD
jgi:hypothetical protein